MRLDEFKIGEDFWAGGQEYRCTDIGNRVVVAIRIDRLTVASYSETERKKKYRTLRKTEAEASGWFTGPPYTVAERVFDEDDLEICETEDQRVDKLTDNFIGFAKTAIMGKSRSGK